MTKKNLVLFFLIAVMISACDLRPFPPIDKVSPQEIKTPTPPLIDSEKISPTGFYWPTGGTPIILQKWLAHGCDESGTYFDGSYHIGLDIDAQVGDPVYSISPGRVIRISPGGWGLTNKAAIIQHFLKDGTPFFAVYGHIHTDLVEQQEVLAGQEIGTIGYWADGNHLHLGVFPGELKNPLGVLDCPNNYSPNAKLETNGTADPMEWLLTRYPGEIPQSPPIDAPGDDGTDEGPTTTAVPATSTPADGIDEKCTLLQENATYARLGHYANTFFVIGDSRVWEAETNNEWPEFVGKPQPINLRHLGITSCVIKVFKEETLPPNYSFAEYDETIGNTQYHVEDFQYASPLHIKKFTEVGSNNEIAVVSEDGNEQCFADARQVLLCSELVEFGPLDLPITSE